MEFGLIEGVLEVINGWERVGEVLEKTAHLRGS
jgi:hypothetical protein